MRILTIFILLMLIPSLCFASASRTFTALNQSTKFSTGYNDVTTEDISWGLWAKSNDNSGSNMILGRMRNSGTIQGYVLLEDVAQDLWVCYAGDGTDTTGTTGITGTASGDDGNWHFWTCTWSFSGQTATLWMDGTNLGGNTGTNIDSLATVAGVEFQSGTADDATVDWTSGPHAYWYFTKSVMTNTMIQEMRWKPCSFGIETCAPMWGDSTEKDLGTQQGSTVQVNGSTSQDGPPVMFGGGLPL